MHTSKDQISYSPFQRKDAAIHYTEVNHEQIINTVVSQNANTRSTDVNHEDVMNPVVCQDADTRYTEVNREDVVNTVVSQSQKSKYNMILFICESWTHRATKW